MKKYVALWIKVTIQTTQVAFSSRLGVALFTFGKIVRFITFIFFLFVIISKTHSLAGYTFWQIILFFLTFNIIDVISQFLWRDVYRFRSYIVTGNFDMILTKPISPLLRALFGGSDILDLITLIPLLLFLTFVISHLGNVNVVNIILYIVLIINGLIIALALHIFVLSLGVITTEVDNAIWMVREILQLGRFPVKVYPHPISFMFTYILPIAALVTIPSHALIGILSVESVVVCLLFSVLLLALSMWCWRKALKGYASASS